MRVQVIKYAPPAANRPREKKKRLDCTTTVNYKHMTGVSRSVLPPAEKGGNKINMASGQQWVLVEMVQAFYEVRRLFSVLQFPGGEKFWAHNRVSSASSTSSSAYQTPAVCEIIKPREATGNFFNTGSDWCVSPGGKRAPRWASLPP